MRYTKEEHEWFAAFIPGHKMDEIAEAFKNKFGRELTRNAIKSYKLNHNIKSGTTKGRKKWSGPIWTPELVEFVKQNNQGRTAKELAELINQTFNMNLKGDQIKAVRGRLKIDSGLTGYFPKGHEPKNKGRKGYCAPGSEKGWFKKGHKPWNHAEVGDEAWTTDGYLKVKIAEPNKWRHKHVLVWEAQNGKVPEGFMVTFRNGNHADCTIENLALISKAENGIMNTQHLRSEDPELTDSGIFLARLKNKISKVEKETK
jgi:hypothetical protein